MNACAAVRLSRVVLDWNTATAARGGGCQLLVSAVQPGFGSHAPKGLDAQRLCEQMRVATTLCVTAALHQFFDRFQRKNG